MTMIPAGNADLVIYTMDERAELDVVADLLGTTW